MPCSYAPSQLLAHLTSRHNLWSLLGGLLDTTPVSLAQGLGHYQPLSVAYDLISLPVSQIMRLGVPPAHFPDFLDHLLALLVETGVQPGAG
jgi:hypothetical protein